jgi:hypothetical protein
LTRLLKNSLEGNCSVVLVACVSPVHYDESRNTLTYASRAARIKSATVKRNDITQETSDEVALLKSRIAELEICAQEETYLTELYRETVVPLSVLSARMEFSCGVVEKRIALLKSLVESMPRDTGDEFRKEVWGGFLTGVESCVGVLEGVKEGKHERLNELQTDIESLDTIIKWCRGRREYDSCESTRRNAVMGSICKSHVKESKRHESLTLEISRLFLKSGAGDVFEEGMYSFEALMVELDGMEDADEPILSFDFKDIERQLSNSDKSADPVIDDDYVELEVSILWDGMVEDRMDSIQEEDEKVEISQEEVTPVIIAEAVVDDMKVIIDQTVRRPDALMEEAIPVIPRPAEIVKDVAMDPVVEEDKDVTPTASRIASSVLQFTPVVIKSVAKHILVEANVMEGDVVIKKPSGLPRFSLARGLEGVDLGHSSGPIRSSPSRLKSRVAKRRSMVCVLHLIFRFLS